MEYRHIVALPNSYKLLLRYYYYLKLFENGSPSGVKKN